MTENEVLEMLKEKYMDIECYFAENDHYPNGCDAEFKEAIATAVKALSEYQKYRSIGTVEEIQKKIEELARWHSDRLNDRIKNEFACMSTLICHNCDHKDEYIEELEAEIEEYEAIGTVEECRAAVEKQRAIKPTFEMNYGDFESLFSCECGKKIVVRHNRGVMDNHDGPNFCSNCGRKLDWSDTP